MMKRLLFRSPRAPQGHFAISGKLSACFAAVLCCGPAPAAVTLNEVDSSTLQFEPSTEGFQFVELKGSPGESLNGYTIVFYNGSNDLVYRVVSLDGFAIGTSGYFVAGNSGVPRVDLVLPVTLASSISNLPPGDDTIQPGPDAVALYHNASNAYVPGSFLTSGAPPVPKSVTTVNSAPGETLVDALLYASFTVGDDLDLKTALGATAQFNENANGNRLTESLSRNGASWAAQEPSPGRENFLAFPAGGKLFLELSDADLSAVEGSAPIASRVKLLNAANVAVPAPAGGITVTVHTTDFSEAALAPGPVLVPGTEVSSIVVTIPGGSSQSADFLVVPQDDGWQDGTQTAFLIAEPPDGAQVAPHSCWLTVTDNDASPSPVVINEVNGYIPAGINTRPGVDANGDGVIDANDRFVEIVNPGTNPSDLSGFRVATDETVVDTFPPCTILLPGQALLVIGGGSAAEGITTAFSNAIVRRATGGLSIHNGTAVRLLNGAGLELAGHVFGTTESGSNVRKADGTGATDTRYGNSWLKVPAEGPGTYDAPFFFGTIVPGSFGFRFESTRPYSTPGTGGDGTTAFVAVPHSLTLTFVESFSSTSNPVSVPELWGKGAAKLTILRPDNGIAPDITDLCVRLVRSNSNAASSPPLLTTDAAGLLPDVGDSIVMAATMNQIDLFLHTTDTTPGNGDNTFTISAFSSAYRNTTQSIVIRDSDASLLSFKCDSIVESAGAGASVLKIAGGLGTSAYLVRSEAVGANPLAAQIPPASANGSLTAGAASVPIDALNDAPVANRQVRFVYLSGPAGDSRNSARILDVIDDGGAIELGPFINEADTAQPVPANNDFVELTVPGGAGKSLAGFVFVVYGPAGTVASRFDLSGSTFRAASDFFVLWNDSASAPGRLNTGANDWLPASGAVAVYRGTPAEFAAGSPATCKNLIDALVFNAANPALQDMLTPGWGAVSESATNCVLARSPDATLASQLRNTTTFGGTNNHRTPGFSNTAALSGYNAYVERFPAAAAQTATDDTDGDGLPNLMEYFMGTSPVAFTADPLPVIAAGTATLTIDRGFDSLCDTHVVLTAESSTNLVTWTPMASAGTDPVVFTAPAPGPKFFSRLKIAVAP
jgi:hypothetical protein